MTESQRQELTMQDFGQLPLRALVGYTARCGRRVFPVLHFCADGREKETALAKAQSALALAEDFARAAGEWSNALNMVEQEVTAAAVASLGPGQYAVYAAAHAAGTALLARQVLASRRVSDAMELVATAFGGYRVVLSFIHGPVNRDLFTGDMVLRIVVEDFERLLAMKLGRFGHAGDPLDTSETGPLGPLWPAGQPSWHST